MKSYSSLVANGPDFDWYRGDESSFAQLRDLYSEYDLKVWAGEHCHPSQGWKSAAGSFSEKRHSEY